MQENNYNFYQQQKSPFNPNVVFVPVPTKKDEEKKEIKKVAMLSGIASLLMFGITFFWSFGFTFLMKYLGFSQSEVMKFLKDPFILQMVQIVLSSLMFTIPFLIVYKVAGYSVSKTIPLSKPKKEVILPLLGIGVGFCAFANICVSIAGSFFESFGIDYDVDFGSNPDGVLGFIISFIATAIIPALVEEFACRGFILGSLRKFGDGFAIIASSIIFGAMHGNFQQIPFAFLVGLVLAYITIKSGTLWIACIVHSINNSVSVLMDYIFDFLSKNTQNLIYNIYLTVCLLAAVVGICVLSSKQKDSTELDKIETESNEKEKYKFFFASPLIIIFLCLCLVEAVTFFF
ncbi:MAG: CPBP family intramembrane metalloprotease [Clostridia bacterium]|nr:CPBP family intramembrane metalloprotease [Clostridia bacterium]